MGKTEVGGPRGELLQGTGALWAPLRQDVPRGLAGRFGPESSPRTTAGSWYKCGQCMPPGPQYPKVEICCENEYLKCPVWGGGGGRGLWGQAVVVTGGREGLRLTQQAYMSCVSVCRVGDSLGEAALWVVW